MSAVRGPVHLPGTNENESGPSIAEIWTSALEEGARKIAVDRHPAPTGIAAGVDLRGGVGQLAAGRRRRCRPRLSVVAAAALSRCDRRCCGRVSASAPGPPETRLARTRDEDAVVTGCSDQERRAPAPSAGAEDSRRPSGLRRREWQLVVCLVLVATCSRATRPRRTLARMDRWWRSRRTASGRRCGCDVVLDRGDEVGDGVEDAAADRFVGQLPEPALDQVEPGRGGRGEVQVEPGMLGQPGLDVGCLWVP